MAWSLIREMEAESVEVVTGGANTQALSRAAAARAETKAMERFIRVLEVEDWEARIVAATRRPVIRRATKR